MRQPIDLEPVNQTILELMMPADVIEMRVGRHRQHGLLQQMARRFAQAHHAHAGVDDQIALAAAHMPDIAAHERHDMRLPQQGDIVIDAADLEPAIGDLKRHEST